MGFSALSEDIPAICDLFGELQSRCSHTHQEREPPIFPRGGVGVVREVGPRVS